MLAFYTFNIMILVKNAVIYFDLKINMPIFLCFSIMTLWEFEPEKSAKKYLSSNQFSIFLSIYTVVVYLTSYLIIYLSTYLDCSMSYGHLNLLRQMTSNYMSLYLSYYLSISFHISIYLDGPELRAFEPAKSEGI